MTNYRDEELLAADLGELYAADVPNLRFEPGRAIEAPTGGRWARLFGGYWRPMVIGAGVATALAVALIAPALRGGETQGVSATEVFERASDAADSGAPADDAQTYHMVVVAEIHDVDDAFTTETWYGGEGIYRIESRGQDGYVFGQVVNGVDVWIYQTLDGVTRAAHGPAAALGMVVAGEFINGPEGLGEVLGQYAGTCQSAEQTGEDILSGRTVYVIVVTPDASNCPAGEDAKPLAMAGSSLTLWVDQETFLTLQMESRDPDGTVSVSQTVAEFAVSPDTPDSVFTYEAPSGVTVVEATDISGAKDAISPPPPVGGDGSEPCTSPKADDGSAAANEC